MKKVSTWRLVIGALLLSGSAVVACSSHSKSNEETTPSPLGQSTAPGPSDPNKPQPDSAGVPRPDQPVGEPAGPSAAVELRTAQVDQQNPANPGLPFAGDAGVPGGATRDAGAGGTTTRRDGGIGVGGGDAGATGTTPAPGTQAPGTTPTAPGTTPTNPGAPTTGAPGNQRPGGTPGQGAPGSPTTP